MNRIRVYCASEVPARSVAKISSYSMSSRKFTIVKPNADNLSLAYLCFVPELIPAGGTGYAYLNGVAVIDYSGSVSPGDKVGTKSGSWEVQQSDAGNMICVGTESGYALVVI